MIDNTIYLDNAATTFPKPQGVLTAMMETYRLHGVSPGRGAYDLATEAEDIVRSTRRRLADFFQAPDPDHVVFCANATDALNVAIQGIVKPGDHIVSTHLEHNSVLRVLYYLHRRGIIRYDLVPFDNTGFIDPGDIATAIRPETKLVVVCHASNVLGTVQPIAEIGRICKTREVPLLIDAAQSAGVIPIDMTSWHLSAIAFTGHKSLFGPTGIGGLVAHPALEIHSTRFGGTGVDSKNPLHTQTWPHRLEAGTLNLLGVIGLAAGLDYIEKKGVDTIHRREMELLSKLVTGFAGIEGVKMYCMGDLSDHLGLVTAFINGIDPSNVATILDGDFGIQARSGLHCAPLVHQTLGTLPNGGIRFSLGPLNTEEQMETTVKAMRIIAKSAA